MTQTPSPEERDGEPTGEFIIDETHRFPGPSSFRYFGESFDPGPAQIISSTNADDLKVPKDTDPELIGTAFHAALEHFNQLEEKVKSTETDPEFLAKLERQQIQDAVDRYKAAHNGEMPPGIYHMIAGEFVAGRAPISMRQFTTGSPTNEHSDLRAYREGEARVREGYTEQDRFADQLKVFHNVELGLPPRLPGEPESPMLSDPTPSEETSVQDPDARHRFIESSLRYEARRDDDYKRQEELRYAAMRFRVYHIPQVPMAAIRIQCNSIDTAMGLLDVLAQYDLFQLHHRVKPDYCNANGIEYYDHEAKTWFEFDVENELEDYREAMASPAAMLRFGAHLAIPGWKLEPGKAMFVEEWR